MRNLLKLFIAFMLGSVLTYYIGSYYTEQVIEKVVVYKRCELPGIEMKF